MGDTIRRANHRHAVVVAGGSGTRLWPLSQQDMPKQMHRLTSDRPLIAETVDRIRGVLPLERIWISTTATYVDQLRTMLPEIPSDHFIVEPCARGTAAAFALIAETLYRKDRAATVFTLASDHTVQDVECFHSTLQDTFDFIERRPGHLAAVGVRPDSANSEMGYIKTAAEPVEFDPPVYLAEGFVEKPDKNLAKTYVSSGQYFWNTAYYCFKASTLRDAYEAAEPGLIQSAKAYYVSGNTADYANVPSNIHEIASIDRRRFPLAVVPATFRWSDIGTWQALMQELQRTRVFRDSEQRSGPCLHVGSNNVQVFNLGVGGTTPVVATVGLKDLIVVCREGAIYILSQHDCERYPELRDLMRDDVGLPDEHPVRAAVSGEGTSRAA